MKTSTADALRRVDQLSRELVEARAQQTATADILKAISRSAFELQTVLDTLAGSAARLCKADIVDFYRWVGDSFQWAASFGPEAEAGRDHTAILRQPGRGSVSGRVLLERKTVHIPDFEADAEFTFVEVARKRGVRAILGVPLLREDTLTGLLLVMRKIPGPFSAKQIKLAETFADQAVIAIENVRLFEEVQERNSELSEALEQQVATSAILKAIAASPTDIQPVLDAVTKNAARLCEAFDTTIFLLRGDVLVVAAHEGAIPMVFDHLVLSRTYVTSRAVIDRMPVHVPDLTLAGDEFPDGQSHALRMGFRTILATPLLREGQAIGALMIRRTEVRPFSAKQIELLRTFADQAVIAIENVRLFEEVQARNREVTEALETQTAMSEILGVISKSPTDVQPVFDMIAESAARLCKAQFCTVFRFDGELVHFAAQHGLSSEGTESQRRAYPMAPGRASAAARSILNATVEQIPDVEADPDYQLLGLAKTVAARSIVSVPMLREGRPVGAINIARSQPGHFPDRQIELLRTFADQAVIAIENVRLFEEVQARTTELTESLERQTAASEILRVIARSPTDVQPVFDTIATSVAQLCAARYCIVFGFDGELVHFVAQHGLPPEAIAGNRQVFPMPPGRGTAAARAILSRTVEQIPDVEADPDFAHASITRHAKVRSLIAVPMLKDDVPAGAIVVARPQTGLFPERQIDLLKTFADQAVIAIENVRLFDEVQATTRDLEESLAFQKATNDVLEVIGRSASDLQPVIDAIVNTAANLCRADMAAVWLLRDGLLHHAAASSRSDPAVVDHMRRNPILPADRTTVAGRVVLERGTIHIPDISADEDYTYFSTFGRLPFGAAMGVPLFHGGKIAGVIILLRKLADPFKDRQIELVETFADQAVIAIENVRLFEEVRSRTAELGEALQQQIATADVLKVISRSAFDLQMVLDTLTTSAAQLCDADMAGITRQEPEGFYYATSYNLPADWTEFVKDKRLAPGRGSVVGRSLLDRKIVHVTDVLADPEYTFLDSSKTVWFRTVLGVPLLREGYPIGVLVLARRNVGPFTEKQIDLIQTFADQAVIAIENARLFDEVQARTADLTEALQQQTATADVLKVISRSTFDLKSVLQTLIDSASKLCRAEKSGMYMLDGDVYRLTADRGMTQEVKDYERLHLDRVGRDTFVGRAALEKGIVHVPDVSKDLEYGRPDVLKLGGIAACLNVPLMREGTPIGVFSLARSEPGPFTQRQIELVQTFADQAVIAIENVRLFAQTEAKTRELAQSLEELRTAQGRLVQTEKLASLGQLTAGIAHEIKNPLNFVNNFSALSGELIDELREALAGAAVDETLRAEVAGLTDLLKGNLEKVVQHGKRADSIVKNMLLHSREGSGEHRLADINAVVEESLNLAYHGARAEQKGFNITLQKSLDPAAGEVDLYPQEITRVLLNLISNGFYATTKRGATARGSPYEPTLIAATRNLGDRVEIRIRDNGTGIPPEVKEKMFNPFFTTKPAGEGTGLGLSLSYDIVVKQHAGTIEVDTEPGAFTEFRIVLPRGAASLRKSGGEA